MKCVFGVTAKKLENMIREITLEVFLYNLFIGTTKMPRKRAEEPGVNTKQKPHKTFMQQSTFLYTIASRHKCGILSKLKKWSRAASFSISMVNLVGNFFLNIP